MISRFSVRFYLALSYGLFVLLVVSGSLLYWYSLQEHSAEIALMTQLKERSRLIASSTSFNQLPHINLAMPASTQAIEQNIRVIFLTPDSKTHIISDHTLTPEQMGIVQDLGGQALSGYAVTNEYYGEGEEGEILYAAAPTFDRDGKPSGAVCLLLPLDEFKATLAQSRRTLVGFSGGVAFLSLLLGGTLATLLTRQVSQAQNLAARVANGDYSIRLPVKGAHELAKLAQNLNKMAEELDQQARMRRFLLASFTHEIARSLGGLRLGVDSLQAGALENQVLAEDLLNDMNSSLKRMEGLIDDLTLVASPERQVIPIQPEVVAIEPLLQGLKSRFWARAESRNIHIFVANVSESFCVWADEARLNQILGNVLDNALKFTPVGGVIELSAENVGNSVELKVRDTGPGIPQDEIDKICEPFYQGSNSAYVRQGMGLGLAIVERLVLAHKGKLELKNHPKGGLLVSISLPHPPELPSVSYSAK